MFIGRSPLLRRNDRREWIRSRARLGVVARRNYIEEVHIIFDRVQCRISSSYVERGKKAGRTMYRNNTKHSGFFLSDTSTTMLSNSAIILLLNQSSKDIEKIEESVEI